MDETCDDWPIVLDTFWYPEIRISSWRVENVDRELVFVLNPGEVFSTDDIRTLMPSQPSFFPLILPRSMPIGLYLRCVSVIAGEETRC